MAIVDMETIAKITILYLCENPCTGGARAVSTEVFSSGLSRVGTSDREMTRVLCPKVR